jgi:hypothetical protein
MAPSPHTTIPMERWRRVDSKSNVADQNGMRLDWELTPHMPTRPAAPYERGSNVEQTTPK